jgi:SpoIID/LytB domain protein
VAIVIGRLMRPARRSLAASLLVLAVACTSSTPAAPPAETSGPSATGSASAPPPSPSAPASPSAAPIGASGRVRVQAPVDGSFLVRGAYPHVDSSCVGFEQPRLLARYPGELSVRLGDDGTLSFVVTLSFEAYLEGIAEVPPTWPAAALEAQAIAARSYALATTGWAGQEGETLDTPICSTTSCQVYRGIPVAPVTGIGRWYAAVRRTAGSVLVSGDRPADTVYFSTSNGRTYGNEDVFGSPPLPYLRPRVERDDGASPLSHWSTRIGFRDLARFLTRDGVWTGGRAISAVSGDGSSVTVTDGSGGAHVLDGSTFRDAVNTWAPCLRPARYPSGGMPVTIPSRWMTAGSTGRAAVIAGRGWGHGAGMVQWGAYGKARRGWSAGRILAFYYGGLRPQPFPEPGLIHVEVASGLSSLRLRASGPGATIEGQELAPGPLVIAGGDELTLAGPAVPAIATASAVVPEPTFQASIARIDPALRRELVGRNWHPGCPVPIADLRVVTVGYWGFDGRVHRGPLVVNARVATDVRWVFARLFDARFRIAEIALPARYRPRRPIDWFSTRNVTAAFNCRPATENPGSLSQHAYGWAIDINPLQNPYVRGDGTVLRRAAAPYRDRSRRRRGMIRANDVVVRSFAAIGWAWGGGWHSIKDYMHFSLTGR